MVAALVASAEGLVDVSRLARGAPPLGLQPQPAQPEWRAALVQVYVRGAKYGGVDKAANGHRADSVAIANGLIAAGISCQLLHYVHEDHDHFFATCAQFDALVLRINPGHVAMDGGSQQRVDDALRRLERDHQVLIWPSPQVRESLGAKDALVRIGHLRIGLPDTALYTTERELRDGLRRSLAAQPRVVKQNRGSAGDGIWIVQRQAGAAGSVGDDERLCLSEASDNHCEEHSFAEFVDFCARGRGAGTWATRSAGGYLSNGDSIIDQRFCPRIEEGELRYVFTGPSLQSIIHKKPAESSISAVAGTGAVYTVFEPDEPRFQEFTRRFLDGELYELLPSLGLADEPFPLYWTADFINAAPPDATDMWVVGEFNCSCVGIPACYAAACATEDNPDACWDDVDGADKRKAAKLCNQMGQDALKVLRSKKSKGLAWA